MRARHVLPALVSATSVLLAAAHPARAESQKFACAMMHFNVQYVAGGNQGFWPTPSAAWDLDADAVEDAIVKESFEPVLDLFLAHPGWATNVEMQGYMLDVMAARHPAVLDKLRTLAKAGRVDVVSFHYSDQLFLAHPRQDWERSADLNDATFRKHDIPKSGTVFCQEGQAGHGLGAAMKAHGQDVLVWPKNLFHFQLGDAVKSQPLYRLGDVSMLTYDGIDWTDGTNDVRLVWTFVDDGELLATGGLNPYFPPEFTFKPDEVAKYEKELADLEAAGFRIGTVAQYVEAIRGIVPAPDAPPMLDGTWQPGSTDGTYKWLGGMGIHAEERDNEVRSLAAVAHREILAAETAAKQAGIEASDEIAAAFRLLALGEVSDASGINPIGGEALYGIAHCAEAIRIADAVIDRAAAALGGGAIDIDVAAGTATRAGPAPAPLASADPPLAVEVSAGDREVTTAWSKVDDADTLLEVRFAAGSERSLSVRFAGKAGDVVYTPALTDAPAHVARSGLAFDHFDLALSDGLVGLGGGLSLVLDQALVHVGARITPKSGDVQVHDDTAPWGEAVTWRFHVVEGDDAKAASVARALNVLPKVTR